MIDIPLVVLCILCTGIIIGIIYAIINMYREYNYHISEKERIIKSLSDWPMIEDVD